MRACDLSGQITEDSCVNVVLCSVDNAVQRKQFYKNFSDVLPVLNKYHNHSVEINLQDGIEIKIKGIRKL